MKTRTAAYWIFPILLVLALVSGSSCKKENPGPPLISDPDTILTYQFQCMAVSSLWMAGQGTTYSDTSWGGVYTLKIVNDTIAKFEDLVMYKGETNSDGSIMFRSRVDLTLYPYGTLKLYPPADSMYLSVNHYTGHSGGGNESYFGSPYP